MQTIDYRRGLPAMAACFLIWGFQPLYWYMCTNVCGEIDTFFLMACRIIWAAVTCLCILKVQGKLPQLWAVFKDKQVLKRELPASVFLFGDWIVYLWAVQNGRVLECSLGYYIQPLVVFALGAVIFKEGMSWRHFIIIGIVVVGIVLLLVTVIMVFISTCTKFGKTVYALGSNERAAALAGINVNRTRVAVYVITGILTGLSAFLWLAMNGSVDPATLGKSNEMYAIAAVVIGGISMSGGKGKLLGVLFGAMSYTIIDKIIASLQVDALINDTIKGSILLVAVIIQLVVPMIRSRVKTKHTSEV